MPVRLRYALCGLLVLPLAAVVDTATAAGRDKWDDIAEPTTGGVDEQSVYSGVTYRGVVFDPPASGDGAALTSDTGSSWTPPACYYAPKWSATEFKAYWEDEAKHLTDKTDPGKGTANIHHHEKLYGENSEYDNYNIGIEDEGLWWGPYSNPDAPLSDGSSACGEPNFWVAHDDPPPDLPGVPDTRMLAELAYSQTEIPDIEVELNPAGAQTVNLDTWIWIETADLAPVSVTASLDGFPSLSSTVTATPSHLTLDAGTDDATLHPGPEGCAINTDGSIGQTYQPGRNGETPPCGMTYLRATHHQDAYPLSANLTWNISWQGSDGNGDTLPDGTFNTTQDITVEEIQTIIR